MQSNHLRSIVPMFGGATRYVETWAGSDWTPEGGEAGIPAHTYETVVLARSVDPEFRAIALRANVSRFGRGPRRPARRFQ